MSDDSTASAASEWSSSERAGQAGAGGGGIGAGIKSRFKILTLVDGILIEPHESRDGGDDDGTASDYQSSTASVGEWPPDEDAATTATTCTAGSNSISGRSSASGVVAWSCPGATPDGTTCDATGHDPRCTHSLYGREVGSLTELEQKLGPDVDGGLVFTVKILPNDYNATAKKSGSGSRKVKFLQGKDYDPQTSAPKPRRKMPFPVTSDDFFSSIVRIGKPSVEVYGEEGYEDLWHRDVRHSVMTDGPSNTAPSPPRWIFSAVCNGWPGLASIPLEVRKIEGRENNFVGRRKGWSTLWDYERGKEHGKDPSHSIRSAGGEQEVRVKLRAPEWSAHGWSETSPGFIFWSEGQKVGAGDDIPLTVTYGTDLIDHFKVPEEKDPLNTRVHMISHRYATGGRTESKREKLTYHSFVLLEWNHGEYCSVVEIGYLNGLGGCKCKSNWYPEKDSQETRLYAAFPPECILPWKETMSEIRVHDVPFPEVESFLGYMNRYDGHSGRFVDIRRTFSHDVRLTYRSRRNVATYLLNYIRRDRTYSEMRRNCQTFAADLCGFLAGKKDVSPFHPVNQISYTCQKHKFLYESSAYRR